MAAAAAPRRRAGKVTTAARKGDSRQVQEALRDRLALAIDDPLTSSRDLAALTRRLQEVVDRLAEDDARRADEAKKAAMAADSDDGYDPEDL